MSDRALESDQDLLAKRAYDALIAHLRAGRLRSGAFLSIPMLVDQLKMPLAAVREAVKRANAGGLLTILPKRGILVMDAGAETTRNCLDLRAMFDAEGARRIIAQGKVDEVLALRAAHQDMLAAARSNLTADLPQRAIATDLSLHDALSHGLGNPIAKRLYAENRNRIAIIQNTRAFLPDRIASAVEEHLAIIDAVEARDAAAAVAAIELHLRNTLRWWGIPL